WCNAFVRLKRRRKRREDRPQRTVACSCGAVVVLDRRQSTRCPCCGRELQLPAPDPPWLGLPGRSTDQLPTHVLDLLEETHPEPAAAVDPTPRPLPCPPCGIPLSPGTPLCPGCGASRSLNGLEPIRSVEPRPWPGDEPDTGSLQSPVVRGWRAVSTRCRAALRWLFRRPAP